MMDPLQASLKIAASGLQAQSARLKVVTENLANAQSAGNAPGADPYTRKTMTFVGELDRASGAILVKADRVGLDRSPYKLEHKPGHPAADAAGYVKMPNVNPLVELADVRQANRSYEANLQIIRQTRQMHSMLIDLLRST